MSVDLSTRYLGLELKNPLVASAGPLTGNLETLCQLETAGIAAAVLPSLFEETIEHEEERISRLYDYHSQAAAESLSYFPELPSYNVGPDHYLFQLGEAKRLTKIPIIASLNGVSRGGWTRYAKHMEDAGADALELNIYFVPTDPMMAGEDVERRYLDIVSDVRQAIAIPLAVKIGPFFSNTARMAHRLVEAGANGLVLFNRYLEPDIDVEELQIEPKLVLSRRHELRLPLRWIAILHPQLATSYAATSGVHFTTDIVKALLAGADVAMMTTALLQHGPQHVKTVLAELTEWLREREYTSVAQMKGSMDRRNCPDAGSLERANYAKALASFTDQV